MAHNQNGARYDLFIQQKTSDIFFGVKYDRRSGMDQHGWIHAGFFHHRSFGSQVASKYGEAAIGSQGLQSVPDHFAIRFQYGFQSFAQGSIESTGRPLDVAIDGDGFFAVSDGEVSRYTRDGEFVINAVGELALAAGEGRWRVLDDDESVIVLNEAGGKVSVSEDGTIRQGGAVAAKLGLMTTADKQSLRKVGENLFEAKNVEMTPVEGRFVPEAREESNFDVMQGLASMIEGARVYQLNAKMVQLQDKMVGQAVSTVGRVA